MNYKKIVTSRIFYTLLILGIQVYWAVLLITRLSGYSIYIHTILQLLSIVMMLYIINRNQNPGYSIGWIALIALLPLFGGLLYLLYGNKKTSRRMQVALSIAHKRMQECMEADGDVLEEIGMLDRRMASMCRYLYKTSGYPAYRKTETKYYSSGEAMFPDMMEAIRNAKHFVFLEFFIVESGEMWDSMLELLRHKAEAGVEIRMIYDDFGCWSRLPRNYYRWMEALHPNIHCLAFNPIVPFWTLVMNHRCHQKALIVDGSVGFTGGINLADEYINKTVRFGYWKDSGIRLTGEGVWNLTSMFLELWSAFRGREETPEDYRPHTYHPKDFGGAGFVQPFADTPLDDEPVARNVYMDILAQAKRYVYIFTPYLILDHGLLSALTLAAGRGVDVRIVTPAIPDKKLVFRLTRSNYEPLLQGGVRIYEFTPGFIHAKSYICDDEFGVVGTVNMDYRSLYLHFEDAVFMYQTESLADMYQDAKNTFEISREIFLKDCKTNLFGRLFDAVFRLVSPLV